MCLAILLIILTGGENFYGCQFVLSSDKTIYLPGDEINLTLTITPKDSKTVHLYRRMEYNMLVRPLVGSSYRMRHIESKSEMDAYELSPDKPLHIQIRGHVAILKDQNKVLIDFGGFGHADISIGSEVVFSVKPYPAKVSSTDSEEWGGSNALLLRFAAAK